MAAHEIPETLQRLLRREPDLPPLLQRHGVDLRFTGGLTLTEVCAMHGLDLDDLTLELMDRKRDAHFLSQETLGTFNVTELVGYIMATHHAYLQKELGRLEELLAHSARLDGPRYPELLDLLGLFADFKSSLEWHMREEEKNLFPYFLDLTAAPLAQPPVLEELEGLSELFRVEEGRVQADLEALRRTTHGYRVPSGASRPTRDLFHDLERMEGEIHRHIHDENYILYPKVAAICRHKREKAPGD
jgi:regulator of cell morphogenesis and NO signaling